MTFLNPFVLFALVTAGIPLIIHLINLRKPRKIDFSSLVFLEELRQQTIRRLRIKQWLLLALRMLAIAFLVLAFARPTVKSPPIASLSSDHRSVVAVIDNSLSMDLRDQGGALLDQATDFVADLADQLESADELAIVPLIDDGLPHPFGRPALTATRLKEITPEYGLGSFDQALANAASALTGANYPVREVYVVSDFQKTNFADSGSVDLSDASRIVLVPIGNQSVDNAAITRARIASSIVEVNQPVTVEVEVQNFGKVPIRNWGLSVYLEGERVAQSTLTLEAGQQGVAPISVTPRSRGWLRGRAVLEEDGFEFDNERWFTLHVPEERKVLIVRGANRNAAYLDLALNTQLRDGRSLFQLDYVDEDAVSGTFARDYDGVVLLGVRRITGGMATALAAFIEDGGGVLMFAGEEAGSGAYDQLLEMVGAGSFDGLVSASSPAPIATVDRLDREHPLFRGVFDNDDADGRDVERPSIMKLVRYRPGDGDEQTLLSTTIGLPMLQEVRFAAGRMLIAPFLPDPGWTDLPVRGLFVPLLFRSMYYLTSADALSGDGIRSGAGTIYRLPARGNTSRIRIVSESGREWIPEQRTSTQGVYFTLPSTLRAPGIYDVMGDGGLVQRFAVNPDALESNLERIDATTAAARLEELTGADVSVVNVGPSSATPGEAIRSAETGVEIWNVFLAVALIFLVAEMLVAARWRPAGVSPGS
ncbi:MAG: BatA and WFA domain-containing protein [Rhodothermales bacterium]